MPDWKRLVEERLASLNLPPGDKEEVIAELAAHLEDSAAADPEEGGTGNRALTQVPWHKVLRVIERTKHEERSMNHRTKTIWLPVIATLFATGVILLLLNRAAVLQHLIWIACMAMFLCAAASEANRLSPRTRTLWLPVLMNLTLAFGLFIILDALNLNEPGIATAGNIVKAFRIPWLVPLPVLGALGALLARRAQASRSERLVAGLAPSLVWLAVLVVVGLVLAYDPRDFAGVAPHDFVLSAIGLVVAPALALSLGVLPFLRESKVRKA
jgi:hypothetical protein